MGNIFYLFGILLTLSFSAYGQNENPLFFCGYDEAIKYNELAFPGYKSKIDKAFREAKETAFMASRNTDILKVKVVVHIVYKESLENLHESIILNQMEVLNKAFRLQNENRNDIRDIFRDVQADAHIEFELQEVIRVKTDINFALSQEAEPDAVKQKSRGGSNAITPEKVLNIWVCRLQTIPVVSGQILGYAYPPAGLGNWPVEAAAPSASFDGVVIDFRVFGSNNPNTLTINGQPFEARGRFVVHEVGHYLGLRHIWGDGRCDKDDGISDTPNQGAPSPSGCNKMANTCFDPPNDLPDMVENYMDYSAETCQNTFTKEQVQVMRSVLMNQRKALISSVNEYNHENNFIVYPNPAKDRIYIRLNQEMDKGTLQLKNILGHIIKNIEVSGRIENIETSNLSAGFYFVEYHTYGKKSIQKIVIHD